MEMSTKTSDFVEEVISSVSSTNAEGNSFFEVSCNNRQDLNAVLPPPSHCIDDTNIMNLECPSKRTDIINFIKEEDAVVTFSVKPAKSALTIRISPRDPSKPSFSNVKLINNKKTLKKKKRKIDINKICDTIVDSVKSINEVKITCGQNSLSPTICKKLCKKNSFENWKRLTRIWDSNVKNIRTNVANKLKSKIVESKEKDNLYLRPGFPALQSNGGTLGQWTGGDKTINFFQNGVVDKPSYYSNPNPSVDIHMGYFHRTGLAPINLTSKAFRSLSYQNAVSDQCIDACIASLVNTYKANAALHLTVFETHILFTNTFTDDFYIFNLNLDRYDIIIMPYADGLTSVGDGHKHWCVLVAFLKTKEIYSYSTFPIAEVSSKNFKYFLKFLEKKDSLNDLELDIKKWRCKIVKHPFQMKINDSGIYLLKFIELMLQRKHFQSINTNEYRLFLQNLCLKSSDSVKGICLYCGKEESGYYEKFKCKFCQRFIHLNGSCIRYFNFSVSNYVKSLENFVCALCALP